MLNLHADMATSHVGVAENLMRNDLASCRYSDHGIVIGDAVKVTETRLPRRDCPGQLMLSASRRNHLSERDAPMLEMP